MLILVHATNLRSAGGLTIALNLIKNIKEYYPDVRLHVLAPGGCGYEAFEGGNVRVEIVSNYAIDPLFRLWTDRHWLKKKLKAIRPDLIFTLGNIALPVSIKQAVIFHYPYAVYPEERTLWDLHGRFRRIDIRQRVKVMASRFKYADLVFPQTAIIDERLKRLYPTIKRTAIVPNAYTTLDHQHKEVKKHFDRPEDSIVLLSLSRYYVHKNLEVFIPLAQMIKTYGKKVRIIITIDADQHPMAKRLLEDIQANGLEEIILNIGNVPINEISSLYDQVDALIMPTLLESFSTTYVDAMNLKKPILTSDRDFAKEVCGDAAWYFDPLSAADIMRTIDTAFGNPDEMTRKTTLGYERSTAMPDWKEVTRMYLDELMRLSSSPPNDRRPPTTGK